MRKKLTKYLIFTLSLMLFIMPTVNASDANTLAELRKELNTLKNKKKTQDNAKKQTKNQISSAKNNIFSSQQAIETGKKQIEASKKEIETLTDEINSTKGSIKKLMNSYQVMEGENIYLDYVFNADSYADLVYRYSLVKQILNYNNGQIEDWESKVQYNEDLQKDLANKEVQLNKSISNLEKQLDSLGTQLDEITEISMDIQEQIDGVADLIKYYESLGCKENENLDQCVSVRGDTRFRKPLTKGTITSYYGYRIHPIYNYKKFHSGVDIGGNKEGTNVYATANGQVGMIIDKTYKKICGGRQVYIYHTINGKKYTSAYLHLLSINVKVGDSVTSNTVIGKVGGGKKTQSWEKCSTGAHLHFTLAEGWYGRTYSSYSTFLAKTFKPQKTLKLPNKNTYWYSR